MPVWLEIIVANVALVFVCYAASLSKELKAAEEELRKAKLTIKQLYSELQKANKQISKMQQGNTAAGTQDEAGGKKEKIPAFLLADDPMEALLKDVGKLSR